MLIILIRSISFVSESPLILLIFGPTKHELMIHKEVLQQAPILADALEKTKPQNGAIRLNYPEHLEIVGDWLAHWLYFGQAPYTASDIASLEKVDAARVGVRVILAYNLACQLKMEEWANHLTNIFMVSRPEIAFSELYEFLKSFKTAYKTGYYDKLGKLILIMMARAIRVTGWEIYTSSVDERLVGFIKKDGDFAVELARYLAEDAGDQWAELRTMNKCLFHVHETSVKC